MTKPQTGKWLRLLQILVAKRLFRASGGIDFRAELVS
jgi:hypothetical protein